MYRYVKAATEDLAICNWVNQEIERGSNIQLPIRLDIGLDKVSSDGMTRYMKIQIDGHDVTQMVANAINCKISKARDTYGDMIVKGVGMDMGFYVQDKLSRAAYQAGYPDMFDRQFYNYLGKRSHGRYPYAK